MRIAVLGGSFDPPHLGHALIARQVCEQLPIDKVWLLPCYNHTFNKTLSDAKDRLAMTKFLAKKDVTVSNLEIKTKASGATIETLENLAKQFPNDFFSWIIGSDQLWEFHRWDRWKEIIAKHKLIVFPREIALDNLADLTKKALKLSTIPKNITLMNSPQLILTNISSSAIRKRIKENLSIDLLVPKGVDEYIRKHKLYELSTNN